MAPLETDPVCGMNVDPSLTNFHSAFGARLFHFCSVDCRDEFNRHPETYVTP